MPKIAVVLLRREFQARGVDLDRQGNRGASWRTSEWRGLNGHRDAAVLKRSVEHRAQLGRCLIGAFGACHALALEPCSFVASPDPRRRITLARRHAQSGPLDAHFDLVEFAVARVSRRTVPKHVVAAVGLHDPIEGGPEGVDVDDRQSPGLLGERAQAVLRRPHLRQKRGVRLKAIPGIASTDIEQVGVRLVQFDVLAGQADEPSRVHSKDVHVCARSGRNGIFHRVEHRRCIVRGENVVNRVIDALAEKHHGFAAASHVCEKLRVALQLPEDTQRALAALDVVDVVASVGVSLAPAEWIATHGLRRCSDRQAPPLLAASPSAIAFSW